MQAFDINVQRIAQMLELVGLCSPLLGVCLATAGPSRLQLGQHVELAGLA